MRSNVVARCFLLLSALCVSVSLLPLDDLERVAGRGLVPVISLDPVAVGQEIVLDGSWYEQDWTLYAVGVEAPVSHELRNADGRAFAVKNLTADVRNSRVARLEAGSELRLKLVSTTGRQERVQMFLVADIDKEGERLSLDWAVIKIQVLLWSALLSLIIGILLGVARTGTDPNAA
ncbi:MAG: hypothetical protein WD226_12820 [Planctomycetota bacterium]